MLPNSKPQITKEALLAKMPVVDRNKYPLIIIGVRGYYADTMGEPGKNDRGIYDDAIFIDSPNVFAAFNGNTDPSAQYRLGLATLKTGVWYAHKIGLHKGYQALSQQMGKVTVIRDGKGEETDYLGINIHRGGNTTTSSEGCQTIPPKQWDAFISLVVSEAKRLYGDNWDKVCIPYILM